MSGRRRRDRAWVAATLLGFAASMVAGCEADALTEIVVVTDTDYAVGPDGARGAYLLSVRWDIDALGTGTATRRREIDFSRRTDVRPPFVVPLVHRGGPLGPIRVAAVGELTSGGTVQRVATVTFSRERTVLLPLPLQRACEGVTCAGGATCADGSCVSIEVSAPVTRVDGGPSGLDDFSGFRPDAGVTDAGAAPGIDAMVERPDGGRDAGEVMSIDAGRADAGRPDAGRPDAGRPDAGRPDAGRPDAGRPDAGRLDAGRADAGRPDAGRPDAGRPDAGRPDAGRPDSGPVDAGFPDASVACVQRCGLGVCRCDCGSCFLECRDRDCERMQCRGDQDCVVEIFDSDDARLECRDGAACRRVSVQDSDSAVVQCRDFGTTCAVSCEDVDECAVECTAGAICLLACRDSEDCEFTRCDGLEFPCRGGVCCISRPTST